MNCLDFRRRVGAEPDHQDPAVLEHARECSACADFAERTQALNRKILQALKLPEPRPAAPVDFAQTAADPSRSTPWRFASMAGNRRMAVAASLMVGSAIALAMWLSFPRATLATDVLAHMAHEPYAWTSEGQLTHAEVQSVLKDAGAATDLGPGRFSYAQSCWFRGHFVPHLVLRDEQGPITVMMLPGEVIEGEVRFSENGYSGVLFPAGRGSIAVLVQDPGRIEAAAAKVRGTFK
jgi:hypothetical protein